MNPLIASVYAFWVEKLPYITIAVFTFGMALRIQRWLSAPKDHHLPKLDIIESIKYIILDVVLFRKNFKSDKHTWALVFASHERFPSLVGINIRPVGSLDGGLDGSYIACLHGMDPDWFNVPAPCQKDQA